MTPRTPGAIRTSLIESSWRLFAASSPAGLSTRAIAEASGCSHGMITATFGGKSGLEHAVVDRLTDTVEGAVEAMFAQPGGPFADFVGERLRHPRVARLIVRLGLGDLDPEPFLERSSLGTRLVSRIEEARGGSPRRPTQRSQIAAYAVLCTVLGAYTFDEFNVQGSRCADLDQSVRDAALVQALELVTKTAADDTAKLRVARQRVTSSPPAPQRPQAHGRIEVREALVAAAVELFAARGPASISTREIAAHAGVGHGLIHRHFGTKESLLNAAIDSLATVVTSSIRSPEGVSVAMLVELQRRSLNPWIIARLMADGVDVTSSRTSYPLIQSVLDTYPSVPTDAGPGDLSDPRLAVYAASALIPGSAIWDRPVRRLVGLPADDDIDIDAIITTFAGRMLGQPPGSTLGDR